MSTSVIIVLAMLIASGIVAALGAAGAGKTEHSPRTWVARRFRNHPRLARFFSNRLDRTRAGGLLLTIGFVGLLASGALVIAVLDNVVEASGLALLDAGVAEYGRDNGDAAAFDLYAWFTHLGGTRVIVLAAVLAAGWASWRHRNGHIVWFMFAVVAGQTLVNNGLKWIIERDRPALNQLADFSGSSFPSGHAAAAAATWSAIALVVTLHSGTIPRVLAAVSAAAVAAGVGATRALLGVHWFTDVVAGLLVGFGWFLVCVVVFGGRIMRFGEPQDEAELAEAHQHSPSEGRSHRGSGR